MDHDAYENHMIDTINQHGEQAAQEAVNTKRRPLTNKNDVRVLVVGLKRTILALLTAATTGLSAIGFIAVAEATGYMAVLLFFVSILGLVGAYILLYAQGITFAGRRGDEK